MPSVLLIFVGFVLALVILACIWLWFELSKGPPTGGTPYTLPNGLEIVHWQEDETKFLYDEIWGKESAYSRGGLIFRPDAVILDAGANIGMFSLFAAHRCKHSARILSFEPIPSTFSVLDANARKASAAQSLLHWTPLNVGLSDKPEDALFEHHPHFSVWSTRDKAFADARLERIEADIPRALDTDSNACVRHCFPRALARALASLALRRKVGITEKVPVKLVTLSSVIEAQLPGRDIDFLKVDVEGAELRVLEGIKPEHWGRIQQVALEVENFENRDKVLAILARQGFATSHFASERERHPGVESEVRAPPVVIRPGLSLSFPARLRCVRTKTHVCTLPHMPTLPHPKMYCLQVSMVYGIRKAYSDKWGGKGAAAAASSSSEARAHLATFSSSPAAAAAAAPPAAAHPAAPAPPIVVPPVVHSVAATSASASAAGAPPAVPPPVLAAAAAEVSPPSASTATPAAPPPAVYPAPAAEVQEQQGTPDPQAPEVQLSAASPAGSSAGTSRRRHVRT